MSKHIRLWNSPMFRNRSADRDNQTDQTTVGEVDNAINSALTAVLAEREVLTRRFADAEMRASIAVGTEHDEYLTREEGQSRDLLFFETEMKSASRRLGKLDDYAAALRFLRASYHTRFPDLRRTDATAVQQQNREADKPQSNCVERLEGPSVSTSGSRSLSRWLQRIRRSLP